MKALPNCRFIFRDWSDYCQSKVHKIMNGVQKENRDLQFSSFHNIRTRGHNGELFGSSFETNGSFSTQCVINLWQRSPTGQSWAGGAGTEHVPACM